MEEGDALRLMRFLYITRQPHSRHRIGSRARISFDAAQSAASTPAGDDGRVVEDEQDRGEKRMQVQERACQRACAGVAWRRSRVESSRAEDGEWKTDLRTSTRLRWVRLRSGGTAAPAAARSSLHCGPRGSTAMLLALLGARSTPDGIRSKVGIWRGSTSTDHF